MRVEQSPFRAAQDGLRLRVGAGLLSLILLAALVAGFLPQA